MIRAAYRSFSSYAKGVFVIMAFAAACFAAFPRAAAGMTRPSNLTMPAEDAVDESKRVTWTLTADKVTSLGGGDVLEAHGNVVLRRGTEYLKADYARYYSTTKWVFLRGNVEALMGKDTMKAEEAEFDLSSRVGWLKRGEIFFDGPHMYLSGNRIDKHWGDVYSFKEAKITVCDGDRPAWSFEAAEAVVEIDGYAQLWKPKFQIMDVPALMAPWMMLPAKKDRQTGFLFPEYSKSSNLGSNINIPFFWAIDESRDVTLNEYFMDTRGLMQGVQYRSHTSPDEMTWLRFDWLHDKKRVTDDSHDRVLRGDGLIRTNKTRYWLRGMHEGYVVDPKWKFRADIDYVSDQNYLYDFKRGMSGFDMSRDTLLELFRRDITEKNQDRKSGAMLFRDWERFSVALSALYTQNPALGHGNSSRSTDTRVQSLPQLDAFLQKGRIMPDFPLEISASAQAAYMYRREGTRGMRYVMRPELSLPVNGEYGSLIMSGGVQQSFYGSDTYDDPSGRGAKQDGNTQTVPFMQIDGSTEIMRAFSLHSSLEPSAETLGKTSWSALRHTVQPRIRYNKTPHESQHKNPSYDDGDRVRPRNELTYSVTNILTRKRDRVIAVKGKEGEPPAYQAATDYLDVLRLTLEQTYDIRESKRDEDRDRFKRRPFGDVILDGTLAFDEFISLNSRVYWSPYKHQFTRQDHTLRFTQRNWGYVQIGHGFRRRITDELPRYSYDGRTNYYANDVKTISFEGELDLYGPLSVAFLYKHDYERKENAERELQVIFNHQCFQLFGIWGRDEHESYYRVKFALTGIGDDGRRK